MDNKILGCVGWLTLIIGITAVGSIINGYVLSVLWGWFFVTIFELPSLTVVQAIGVGLVITFLTHHNISHSDKSKDTHERIGEAIGNLVVWPILALLTGYIVHSLM